MKYTEKRLEQFDIRKVLPFTMGYAQRHPHEMESTVADKINAEVNYAITQAIAEERKRVMGEINERLNKLQTFSGIGDIGSNELHLCVRGSDVQAILSSLDKEINN